MASSTTLGATQASELQTAGAKTMQKSSSAPAMNPVDAFGNTVKRYTGQLQQTLPRVSKRPPVNFEKGGSDFRCPHHQHTSALGKQMLAWPHTASSGNMKFTEQNRFKPEYYRSPGPKFSSPSSLGKQPASRRPSLPSYGFG